MANLKICRVGNSLGAVFPKELLEALSIEEGDELYMLRTEHGFELTPYTPEFSAEIEAYHHAARRHQNALRKLSR